MNVTSRQLRRSPLPHHHRQRGNTLVGIIIGLVIGLIIAVIVALAITKGATPFTDKGKAGHAADPTPGQVSDPNKPMYGSKDAARAANAGLASKEPKAAPVDAQQDGAANPNAPVAVAPVAAAAPVAAKPDSRAALAEKPHAALAAPATAAAAATPAAATPAHADAGDDKFVYYLQAGAFRDLADAESARAKLALLGFEAAVSDRSTDTGVLHRVRMGPYNQVETMNKMRGKLSENGVDVAVVRNQK